MSILLDAISKKCVCSMTQAQWERLNDAVTNRDWMTVRALVDAIRPDTRTVHYISTDTGLVGVEEHFAE